MAIKTIGSTGDAWGKVPESEEATLAETPEKGQNLMSRIRVRKVANIITHTLRDVYIDTCKAEININPDADIGMDAIIQLHNKSIEGKKEIEWGYVVYEKGAEYIPYDSSYAKNIKNNQSVYIVDLYKNWQRFHVVEGTHEEEISWEQKYMVIIESNEWVRYRALSK